MNAPESDDDEYEVVGYAGARSEVPEALREDGRRRNPSTNASSAIPLVDARAPTSARKAPKGFDWDDAESDDDVPEGLTTVGEDAEGVGVGRGTATPPGASTPSTPTTPRRSPRLAERSSVGAAVGENGGTPSPRTAARRARDAAIVAEALGVSADKARAAARAIRGGEAGMAGTKTKAKTKGTKRAAPGTKARGRAESSPKRAAKRSKAPPARASGGVLGRLTLLTQGVSRPTAAPGGASSSAPTPSAPALSARPRERRRGRDPLNGGGSRARRKRGWARGFIKIAQNVIAHVRTSIEHGGLLTTRFQRVMQNAKMVHAQFLKRVASNQLPSSRGALMFTVNNARLDASLTNCAGSVCDLHRATSDDYAESDIEHSRAIVIFNSTQAQELSLERGRRVAIYPPWREIDLPGRVDASTSNVDENVPRVILCAQNVLRLD
ncbi:hypothetical protein BE221DRAFT_61287 [Ostreococcus tauri]|uniref:Uncharacterized protein n=1 Tax=Ostreococcus tauri TaxID=70448 RepID=A0A1Y5HZZ0_OSTTA|nr:hypothetical protein BE221DRAFT_61287 [Ostreococcus tauri]